MKAIQAVQNNREAVQAKDTKRTEQQLSAHDLAGIRNRGSASCAVDLAGWLRSVFRK
jgi:hypothetical protein